MDPTCYSFKKISEKNGICVYYTNPTKATISTDIVEHYDNALKQIGNNKWITRPKNRNWYCRVANR